MADKSDADVGERVPEILWYYQALAHVISRKAVEEAEVSGVAEAGEARGRAR
jgi:hypothetical protein